MKSREILNLYMLGDLNAENTSLLTVDETFYDNFDLHWAIGAVDNVRVPVGEYVVAYETQFNAIESATMVNADYKLHDEFGNYIYLIRIED